MQVFQTLEVPLATSALFVAAYSFGIPRRETPLPAQVIVTASVFLWPLFALCNFTTYLSTEPDRSDSVRTFGWFLPVFAVSSIVWASAWAAGLWLVGLM
jgi:hypothetical protein